MNLLRRHNSVYFILLFFTTSHLLGQTEEKKPPVTIHHADTAPIIDGKLDDDIWQEITPASGFWQNFPSDSILSPVQTELFFASDDKNLYIAARCKTTGNDYVINSLRRDFRAGGNDNITFLLDPFNDNINAFVFGLNPLGVNREAIISNGGQSPRDFNENWDNKWKGDSKIGDHEWTCEAAIPFSTLRFNPTTDHWSFNSYRFDTQSNTQSTFNRIPRNQIIMSLGYMSPIAWEKELSKTGPNISLIPYLSAQVSRDYEVDDKSKFNYGIGGDMKIGLSPSMNLDVTINPDFSQVEVDDQVLNLDRFELFFPEKRQFFLENADLFGSFGFREINPFFSRRIGLGTDTSGTTIEVPIIAGARLSGKLNNNWRLGLLNMTTNEIRNDQIPKHNYSVLSLQRRVGTRSNIGAIVVNDENIGQWQDIDSTTAPRNTVAGLEYNLISVDNKWLGKVFYQQNYYESDEYKASDMFSHGLRISNTEYKYRVSYEHQWVGAGFNPQVGYLRRSDYFSIEPEFEWFFYPSSDKIASHSIEISDFELWKPDYGHTDRRTRLSWRANFNNSARLFAFVQNNFIKLTSSFDPTNTDGLALPELSEYNFTRAVMGYNSDRRKRFSYQIGLDGGGFFNGTRYGGDAELNYRFQPYGSIGVAAGYAHIDLPDPYNDADLVLLSTKLDITFTKSLFFNTYVQYNTQSDLVGLNARLQWRFAPVSDIYLVYSHNYDFDISGNTYSAIILKGTYWFNL